MKHKYSRFFIHLRFTFLAIALLASTVWAEGEVAYDFALEVEPGENALYATVRINLPSELAGQTVEFLLTDAIESISSEL